MIPYLSQIKMALMAGAALALVTGTAYITHRFDSGQLNAFKAAQYKQAAEDNAKAVAMQQQHDAAVAAVVTQMSQDASKREAQLSTLRKAVNAAPKSRACVDSPAIRALFGGGMQRPAHSH